MACLKLVEDLKGMSVLVGWACRCKFREVGMSAFVEGGWWGRREVRWQGFGRF